MKLIPGATESGRRAAESTHRPNIAAGFGHRVIATGVPLNPTIPNLTIGQSFHIMVAYC